MADIVQSVGEMEADNVSPNVLALEAAAFVGICAIVVIGNTLICVVDFDKLTQMRLVNVLLLGICTVDIFVSLMAMPLIIVCLIRMRWEFGDSMCKATGMATFFFITISILGLSLAFFYHVVMIFKGCIFSEAAPIRREGFLAVGLFMLGISVCILLYIIDWKVFQRKPSITMCVLTNSPNYSAYKMFYGFFSLAVPLIVMMMFAKSEEEKKRKDTNPRPDFVVEKERGLEDSRNVQELNISRR